MVYGYMTKYHGQYYPAGAEVPVGNTAVEDVIPAIEAETETVETAVEEKTEQPRRGRKRGK